MIRLVVVALACHLAVAVSAAELEGHGGPVRAIAADDAQGRVLTGSFDTTAILWTLRPDAATKVLRFHSGGVNAVALLPDNRLATAGEDGRIAIWAEPYAEPITVLTGHEAPIVALSQSPDGRLLGSAAWDGTARIWTLDAATPARVLSGHTGNVNGVGFLPGGEIATVGYDATLRIWPPSGPARVTTFPAALNALAVLPDGRLALGGSDGEVRLVAPASGVVEASRSVSQTPVIALAANDRFVAASGLSGAVAILGTVDLAPERTLVGPGLPVWSLAFAAGTDTLFTGGSDGVVRRWDAATGRSFDAGPPSRTADPLAAYGDDPGAAVFRACAACHTLSPGEGPRAGPSLFGIMGRRIGTLPGFDYSPDFAERDIVWSEETIARLFEIGPHAFTPGTKMPEQRIVREDDRAALVRFLTDATRPR